MMNFLAHAYLSGDNAKILVGNFIADFVKGKQAMNAFEGEIKKGIEFHRIIDEFTDTNEIVHKSKARLKPKYRHYSAVIVDVFYDHFLATDWSKYHDQPLAKFTSHVYAVVESYKQILPEGASHMLPYMSGGDWLLNYSKIEGIHRALSGMSRRTPYESKMEQASEDLRTYYEDFKTEFELFFPLLKERCDEFMRTQL
jgi:acyl carrier protein phosphodiesterase